MGSRRRSIPNDIDYGSVWSDRSEESICAPAPEGVTLGSTRALAVLDTPNRPRSNLEPLFRDRLPAHLAYAVTAVGDATSSPTYLLQHREQVLLCRHCGKTVYRHRGPVTDTLAEGDRTDLTGRLGQLRQLVLEALLPLSQEAVDVKVHLARVGRALPSAVKSDSHRRVPTTRPGDPQRLWDTGCQTVPPDNYSRRSTRAARN